MLVLINRQLSQILSNFLGKIAKMMYLGHIWDPKTGFMPESSIVTQISKNSLPRIIVCFDSQIIFAEFQRDFLTEIRRDQKRGTDGFDFMNFE